MSESITEELREYAAEHSYWRRGTEYVTLNDLLPIADRIDARFDRELQSKQGEVDGLKADVDDLQARLDASILPPVDIDGARWTGEDVDWLFSYEGDESNEHVVREIAYAWPRDGWFIVDQYDTHYPADKCRHVDPEPPETLEDVRKSCDNTIAYLASVSGMGWHDVETFSKDVHKQLDHAYACGKRDGAGEQR